MGSSVSNAPIDDVLDSLRSGLTLRKACALHGVELGTFLYRVTSGGHELALRYGRAMEARADVLADETLEIADDPDKDPNRARNQVQARQWVASKTAPKKFGERIDLNVTQSLDIRAILADARGRLRPMCDQLPMIDGEVIESNALTDGRATDNESVIDIFS